MVENNKKKWDWKKEIEENEYLNPIQRRIIERLHDPSYKKFNLDKPFVNKYSRKKYPIHILKIIG